MISLSIGFQLYVPFLLFFVFVCSFLAVFFNDANKQKSNGTNLKSRETGENEKFESVPITRNFQSGNDSRQCKNKAMVVVWYLVLPKIWGEC